ncbi:(deoxy)nucleoside triphosphate pyrophosphohydrolase [Radiobacillus kanasensis]|uniref:(deoxy)nucleoside triphosphate pyrophosphohydrolase n=1 Tax=Radiobacillus kanasensis TaxID=2844358 RepID=UPI001E5AA658|nr:(deoxy)nucleoside triphosphate pyrophosphohydrolase [Radiobacillus kanasensis]UFU00751.1 (deoxy)nucleoside triphosphate pyrophosphohydrolase [Radiobacillus kanasensis]
MQKVMKVVAAVIENDRKEVLCALRSPSMEIPNRWEFPGGKVEKDEDVLTAIVREIKDELGCEVKPVEILNDHTHHYDTFTIQLIAIKCALLDGEPTAKEHSTLLWLNKNSLESLRWAPADIPAVQLLINEK